MLPRVAAKGPCPEYRGTDARHGRPAAAFVFQRGDEHLSISRLLSRPDLAETMSNRRCLHDNQVKQNEKNQACPSPSCRSLLITPGVLDLSNHMVNTHRCVVRAYAAGR
jgi:hypothetical protein